MIWNWGSLGRYIEAYGRCCEISRYLWDFEKRVTPKQYGIYLASKKRRKSKGKKKRR